ncbi:TonB-dependent receptor [Hymenobacter sp. GOD-10R]|uniref:SusC/RagA family TonB-linked outer membrane protein n=1 Tax=Hymenobacter sp. GOD-10R TaxID=3093922 RepID=UPI002D77E535|nr:TonB-dependent receptor [Hymenobacter sp. GOD-10R]WRQ30791.1 TonB-dependent receptor [Hymenobacter sp. GOD-10R]
MKSLVPLILLAVGLPALAHGTAAPNAPYFHLAATGPITGKVLDENGAALPGVTVRVKGTTAGTTTNQDGTFTLSETPENATLIFSFIGYKSQEVTPGRDGSLIVRLAPNQGQLNEVVVVGYGTQQRKNLTGSIVKVDPSDTKDIPVGSFDAQLQGKVSGVQISSNSGVPGQATNVRVRGATTINGSNTPLYVVDGVFMNNNSLQTISTGGKASSPIADLNPADIENIEVLKDADATALYGARGANGVILVTTKRGNFNQKPKISLNASEGWAKAAKLWDLATGPEHATLVNENWLNTTGTTPHTSENRPYRPVSQGGRGLPEEQPTYDRLSQVFRTARLQNYDLSVSGGSASTRYYIGGGYTKQESILRPIDFQRASFKVNLDQQISDKVQIGVSNSFSRTYRNEGRAGDGPAGGLLQAALHTPTLLSPYDANGQLVGRASFDNVELLVNNYDVNSTSLRYIGNLYGDVQLLPNLKFRTSFGVDYNNYDESEYWNTFLIAGAGVGGLATSSVSQYTSLLNENTLTYRQQFGKHGLGIVVGNGLQSDTNGRTFAQGTGFPNNSFKEISAASVTSSTQNWSGYRLASFFGRADYNFNDRYLLNVSFRTDGSSRFGKSNQWGYFPSVGAAWRIKQENFLQNVHVLSDLKLRASYGLTGNQNGIGNFAARGLWNGGSNYLGSAGIAPQQLSNPDLKWEQTSQANIGLDVAFFDGRLGLEFNAYRKYTKNGLIQLTEPATTGFSSYWANAVEVSNKGVEFALNSVNIRKEQFTWNTNFNIASNVNNIEKLATPTKFGSRDLILQQQGSPLYSFWLYEQLYVDPQTGNAVYRDVDSDGKITAADRHIVGNIWPKFFGGLTNSITYKGFDANVLLSFQYGNKVYNHNRFFGEGGGARDEARVIFASNLKRWQKPGDVTDVPKPDGINVNNYLDGGSRWLEDGSFLRLRSLSLGYTIPERLTKRLLGGSVRVYAQGTNLFLLTKYTGLDPESASSSDANQQGIDLGTPPQPRSLQVGINATF